MKLRSRVAFSGALILLTLAAYEGVRRCDFVGVDDGLFVYANPYVRQGVTWMGTRWALAADLLFESPHADYWMPLVVLSRMLEVQVFGLNPAGHHGVNVVVHGINALLVFYLLDFLTAARGRSAFVAALFAVHPLSVESVAWVSELKSVLSGLFFLLALLAYARYATRGSRRSYAAAVLLMALGLMAKPILVTLPLVFLVLDFWPLERLVPSLRERRIAGLLREKWPFFLCALVSVPVTLVALARGGNLVSVRAVPLASRIANALSSLIVYLGSVAWPTSLAVFYPLREARLLSGTTVVSVVLLGLFTWVACRNAVRRPYLLAGWLFYLITIGPVLGIIQAGEQTQADRFMYLPLLGIGIVIAWGAHDLATSSSSQHLQTSLPWLAAGVLVGWTVLTREQVRYWETSVSLFSHAAEVVSGNFLAENNLATALAMRGDVGEAERHYREAIRIRPAYWQARTGLGVLLLRRNRLPEALEQQQEALRLLRTADTHFNLAMVEMRMGRAADASANFAEAVRLSPGLAAAHRNWGSLLAGGARWPEAEARLAEAVRLEPENVESLNNLGMVVGLQGRWEEAAALLARAVAADPGYLLARVNLGRALRGLGRKDEARAQWQEVVRLGPQDPAAAEATEELSARP